MKEDQFYWPLNCHILLLSSSLGLTFAYDINGLYIPIPKIASVSLIGENGNYVSTLQSKEMVLWPFQRFGIGDWRVLRAYLGGLKGIIS